MPYTITFESKRFDLSKEKENPIKPVRGISIGEWLAPVLTADGVEVTEIDAKDSGWDLYATLADRRYLVGFVGLPATDDDEAPELIISIDKQRSFIEQLSLKGKMDADDPLLVKICGIVEDQTDFSDVEVTVA